MQPEIERRVLTGQAVELRTTADGKPMLTGYAALYDAVSEPLGSFREVLRRGCFDAVMATQPDVLARAEHDSTLLLGRTSSGTCRLFLDERGLRYEVDVPDTTAGRDMQVLVQRGDVKGSSFAFMVSREGQNWTTDERGGVLREITNVAALVDVAPTCDPAYRQTTVSARALEEARSMSDQKKPAPETRALDGAGQMSLEERCGIVARALRALLGDPWYAEPGWCVEATFDASVVVERGEKYLSYPLTWAESAVTLGEPMEVQQHFRSDPSGGLEEDRAKHEQQKAAVAAAAARAEADQAALMKMRAETDAA